MTGCDLYLSFTNPNSSLNKSAALAQHEKTDAQSCPREYFPCKTHEDT